MDAAAEIGRNPVSKHHIQSEYGGKQADAGRDCRTRLARPNSQARTGTGKYHFSLVADHEQDWQSYSVDLYSCYMFDHSWTNKCAPLVWTCHVQYSTCDVMPCHVMCDPDSSTSIGGY